MRNTSKSPPAPYSFFRQEFDKKMSTFAVGTVAPSCLAGAKARAQIPVAHYRLATSVGRATAASAAREAATAAGAAARAAAASGALAARSPAGRSRAR